MCRKKVFFVDKPYVSDFFKKTVRDNAIPVVGTGIAKKSDLYAGTKVISESQAIGMLRELDSPALLTLSENSIGWISKHLSFSDLPRKIALFKDKLKFRELTESLFPNFYFKGVRLDDLKNIPFKQLPLPFIIKPSVGFFSMGVYKVSTLDEWNRSIDLITAEIDQVKALYPAEVLDTRSFIIEQCINGDEFAIDTYYNAAGEAVILSIFNHVFSSDTDVSDRVYVTSINIIEHNLEEFTEFSMKIGQLAGVKNFPVHIELRRDSAGTLMPIEVNPMRFGGWCTTADTTFLAYGFNPYTYYYSQQKPNWPALLQHKEGKLFSIVVLDNSTGIQVDQITSFDYEQLLSTFENPLELRKIDYKEYPVFGFLFTETREGHFQELKNILDSDLSEFVSTKHSTALA